MEYLDILIFAAVAVFVFVRLWSVLGRREDGQPQRPNPFASSTSSPSDEDDFILLPDRTKPFDSSAITEQGHALTSLAGTLDQIKALDAKFDEKVFLQGAKAAFTTILAGFAGNDLSKIAKWLAPDVLESFQSAIDARQSAGQSLDNKLVRIADTEISAARLDGTRAHLTVAFVSHQINVVRDPGGDIVSGAPDKEEEVHDVWVFARDMKSPNPNWTLIETRA